VQGFFICLYLELKVRYLYDWREKHKEEWRKNKMGLFEKLFGKKENQDGNKKMLDTSLVKIASKMMDEELFWKIVQESLDATKSQDDQEDCLINELQRLALEDIIGFRLRTDKLLYDTFTSEMWCAAYIINGGCSDDGFEYFRCWLISRGENVYKKAKENPDSLIDEVSGSEDLSEFEFESFWYVALKAFEKNTDKNLYDFIDYENFKTCEGNYPTFKFNWKTEEPETMKRICPKLYEKFYS
jgi:hypothetical protein